MQEITKGLTGGRELLEAKGLLEIIEDQSGVGTGFGAFPSKVKILNY